MARRCDQPSFACPKNAQQLLPLPINIINFARLIQIQMFQHFSIPCLVQRFLQELAEQFKAEEDGPLFLYIDSRITPVDGPEGISKALCDAVTSEDVLLRLAEFADYLKTVLVSTAAEVKTPVGDLSVKLAEFFGKDEENLATTLKKLKGLFTALKSLPRKPVVVIGTTQVLAPKQAILRWL